MLPRKKDEIQQIVGNPGLPPLFLDYLLSRHTLIIGRFDFLSNSEFCLEGILQDAFFSIPGESGEQSQISVFACWTLSS